MLDGVDGVAPLSSLNAAAAAAHGLRLSHRLHTRENKSEILRRFRTTPVYFIGHYIKSSLLLVSFPSRPSGHSCLIPLGYISWSHVRIRAFALNI
jgi:hypothetical protein